MKNYEQLISRLLLQSKAIKLNTAIPFTWASGWKSPIYCDNRKTLSYPEVRKSITQAFAEVTRQHFPETTVIAGVATGAIAQGALVADSLGLPFAYVRSAPKKHGMENLIEGEIPEGAKVLVLEDLVSTGGSSINAVNALRNAGHHVVGMVAIFTYGFQKAVDNFSKNNCSLVTLTNYNVLTQEALSTGYIAEKDIQQLKAWRENPGSWMQN